MTFEKGATYPYPAIDEARSRFFQESGVLLGINSYGPPFCGQQLLVIDDGQKTFSFLLSGAKAGVFQYDCVFAG